MQRWVLDLLVWEKLLTGSGFALGRAEVIRDPGDDGTSPMATLLICGNKPDRTA